jgi:GNAT superfamily N-acetyltransferase
VISEPGNDSLAHDDLPVTASIRQAGRADLDGILVLLDGDAISVARQAGATRSMTTMRAAYDAIERDPNNELWIATAAGGEVIACLQLTFIPGLSRNGMRRAQVEAVRVRVDLRGQRIGERLMRHVIERAREQGCGLMQLTSDSRREDAHRFYRRLGFVASHVGMKLDLSDARNDD